MPFIAFILFLAASILCSGCRTYSPEVKATLEKYRMIKQGMTRSQVYAVLPQKDIFQRLGADTEIWHFSTAKGDVMTNFTIDVTFGADGRVQKITRDIEDMRLGLMTK